LLDLVSQNPQHPIWGELASKYVECGACNFACPTCHCFLLAEAKVKREKPALPPAYRQVGEKFERLRLWDSCQYAGFARVAGGANPRKRREECFKNRFDKKFDFFYKHLNLYACTGCGRCIEACPAGIDLREVFIRLSQ
jgi:ferredoxin